jgi:hypothetical protein
MVSYEDDWQQAEQHQDMLERQEKLIQAMGRAINGVATPDDWNHIRFECGLSDGKFREVTFNTNLGEQNEFSS